MVDITGIYILLAVQGTVSGYTGKEIVLKLGNAEFIPLNGTTNYQIKINVNYSVTDPILIGQKVNAVMKVQVPDGTVLKTTSFPSGFAAQIFWLCTTVDQYTKIIARNITTEIVFTDLNKTNVLSNTVETLPHIANLKTSESMPTITNTT